MAQSFASGIPATNGVAQPSTCDTDTLETSSGPAKLRAEFTPEVINLRWYNDDTRINVPTSSNTCTYGTAISLPQNPTKPGYKFAGWEVLQYDFSTLDASIYGSHRYGRGVDSNNNDVCLYDTNIVTCDEEFADLGRYQWKTPFSYGTIYGDAMCSETLGTQAVAGNPLNNGGQYCWCRATGYKIGNIIYSSNSPLSWVFDYGYRSASVCAANCAYDCSVNVRGGARFPSSCVRDIWKLSII